MPKSTDLPPGFTVTPAMVLAVMEFLARFPEMMSRIVQLWGSGGEPTPEQVAAFEADLAELEDPDSYYATPTRGLDVPPDNE